MLRNHGLVIKTVGYDRDAKVACATLASGVSSMQMRLVFDFELRGVKCQQSLLEKFLMWINHF